MISVVIPTLNEAANLPAAVATARGACTGLAHEVIVSDCGSTDATCHLAARLADRTTHGSTCRAEALNAGAAASAGDVLLFLHADTTLPPAAGRRVVAALGAADVVGGAFDFTIGGHEPAAAGPWQRFCLAVICAINRVRYRRSREFFGDQAIFCRRKAFAAVGGFPRQPLMEDLLFSRQMAQLGRTAILWPGAGTSPRRFLACGVIRQGVLDLALIYANELGLEPKRVWQAYNALNQNGHKVVTRRRAVPTCLI